MQAIGNSALFGSGQAQRLLGALLPQPRGSAGQTSPVGANDTAAETQAPPPPRPDQGPGRQFAQATLAGLLSLQQQQPTGAAGDLASALIGQGDKDGDGALSVDEISAQLTGQGAGVSADSLTAAIGKLDTDGDGKLSGAELAAAIDAMMKKHDGSGLAATAGAPAGAVTVTAAA